MRPDLGRTILGGFVGTLVITLIMTMMGINIGAVVGMVLGIGPAWGMVEHFFNGTIIFPLLYAYIVCRFVPGRPVMKGLWWGAILWFFAQVLFAPVAGMGIFSMNAGPMAWLGSLVNHLIYGALQGWIAGPAKVVGAFEEPGIRRAA